MEKLKSRNEAIKNLLRAFHMLQPSDELAKLQLLLRLGNIYDEMGNFPSAIKCLEDAKCIAVNYDDQRYHIDVLGKLAAIYYKKNEIDKTLQYISVCEKLLYSLNLMEKYPEGYLSCKEVQARVYHLKQDHVKVKEICIRGIDLCGDEFFKLKGLFYKNLGNSYIETGKIEKAQDCYEKSLVCFEKVNNAEGIAMALNNLSVVYGDFYQNTEKAISYMVKMKEISEKNHIVIYEVMALANLAHQ
jgi:tetratricopeptide (TPR) repeat protein